MDNDEIIEPMMMMESNTYIMEVDFANRLDVTETIADVLATPLRPKKDGTSFAKLVETLTAVDATNFCIAVEVKQEEQKIREEEKKKRPDIFGACVVFPKGQG